MTRKFPSPPALVVRMKRTLLALVTVIALATLGGAHAGAADGPPQASAFTFNKFLTPAPACAGASLNGAPYFKRTECGRGGVTLQNVVQGQSVKAVLTGVGGADLGTVNATFSSGKLWNYPIAPEADWPAGPVTVKITADGTPATGEGTFHVNELGVELEPEPGVYAPGTTIPLNGKAFTQTSSPTGTRQAAPGAQFRLRSVDSAGTVTSEWGPFVADSSGNVTTAFVPPDATADLDPGSATGWREVIRLELVDASYDEGPSGQAWGAPDGTSAGLAAVSATPDDLVLENSFVSSKGWVVPGETYPFTVRVKNYRTVPVDGGTVTITVPDGTTLLSSASWTVGNVPAATGSGSTLTPGEQTKVFEARADTLEQDPQIVWKDLSATATLSAGGITQRSHGPKVIPPRGGYDTARYGDRPFPVVPVDYFERKHATTSSSGKLATKINDPAYKGSTFNLYQEMSFRQLFPHGTVPSDGVAAANWAYGPGFDFTKNSDNVDPDTCRGVTNAELPNDAYQSLQPERIEDGWYQLPGSTDYYGDDGKGSALIGSATAVGALQDIDSACGPTGKLVYDSAQIADPEIDYNDYDTDKDGVVDFFMVVFAGLGGNGDSQVNGGYDNVWPHSSDLQGGYVDPDTGEKGYVSDDQLTDLEGRKLFWTDASRSAKTTTDTGIPVYVRVGPYNVNPESAIEKASVISHEYGHSLGLPDYYSTGSRKTYGTWTLMAEDHSHNIDIVGKKELGWVVPRVLEAGKSVNAAGWKDTKVNTHRIDWKQPDGTAYTLQGADVNNGEGYVAPLPARQIIDPAAVPSGDHLWWSASGNDFGCPPSGGHNLDIALPALGDVAAGTKVTMTFKSSWDIEWDYDYGFVLSTTDNGKSYTAYPSAKGYTTEKTTNPNANGCQGQYGNGLTGTSGSYKNGTQTVDRAAGNYPGAPFVDDEYDLSALAGKAATVRLSYATDPGLARPGWFIDDLVIKAGDRVLYESDFETANDTALYPGGCREGLSTAQECTDGWTYVSAADGSPAEHAYLLEMRDRSGFDFNGRGEDDRDPPGITFEPGVLLAYTDENHGYGNVGTDDPPAQSPLDSQPQPGNRAPNLNDAAFTAADGDAHFDDNAADPHVDNYTDASRADSRWTFDYGCLAFDVTRMAGTDAVADQFNLDGDVAFTTGTGCGAFNYGNGATGAGVAPAPPAQAPAQESKPKPPAGDVRQAAPPAQVADGCVAPGRAGRARYAFGRTAVAFSGTSRVDVFQASTGTRVLGLRRVARLTAHEGRVTWRPGYMPAGIYMARLRTADGSRRFVYEARGGRLVARRDYEAIGCRVLNRARLVSPAFGGSPSRSLQLSVHAVPGARSVAELRRGSKLVKRVRGGSRLRMTVPARGLSKGLYTVRVQSTAGGRTERATLGARRL
jgi:M6 family metalloprotease-like protein